MSTRNSLFSRKSIFALQVTRGIIFVGDKLLLIEDNKGEVKLPGGGQESGECDADTLIREIREETGCIVIPETIRPFGYIEEKRKGFNEDRIFHQFSRLYFCEVSDECGETQFSDNKKRHGMRFKTYTVDERLLRTTLCLTVSVSLHGISGNIKHCY